jgi:hypothetical protein
LAPTYWPPPAYAPPPYYPYYNPYPPPGGAPPGYWYPPPVLVPVVPRPPPPPPPPRTITADFGLSSVGIEYEQSFARWLSVFTGPTFAFGSARQNAAETTLYAGGGKAGLRAYLGQRAPKGSWFNLDGSVFYSWARFDNGDRVTGRGGAIAALFGYTWIWTSGVVLSIGGGMQYLDFGLEFPGLSLGFRGVLPAVRGAIGYAF